MYLEIFRKVSPNSKNFDEMVLAHQVNLFSPEPSFDIIPKVSRKNFYTEKFLNLGVRVVGMGPQYNIQFRASGFNHFLQSY